MNAFGAGSWDLLNAGGSTAAGGSSLTWPEVSTANSWSDTLQGIFARGANAYIDSQLGSSRPTDPTYNTAGGKGGVSQYGQATGGVSGVAVLLGIAAVAVVALLVLRR